jgi:hypothetical protein
MHSSNLHDKHTLVFYDVLLYGARGSAFGDGDLVQMPVIIMFSTGGPICLVQRSFNICFFCSDTI